MGPHVRSIAKKLDTSEGRERKFPVFWCKRHKNFRGYRLSVPCELKEGGGPDLSRDRGHWRRFGGGKLPHHLTVIPFSSRGNCIFWGLSMPFARCQPFSDFLSPERDHLNRGDIVPIELGYGVGYECAWFRGCRNLSRDLVFYRRVLF